MRLAEVQRDLLGLASIARAYNVATGLPQWERRFGGRRSRGREQLSCAASIRAGWATISTRATPPKWPVPAAPDIALRLALPRLKAVTVHDFTWSKDGPLEGDAMPARRRRGGLAASSSPRWPACASSVRSPSRSAYPSTNELNAFRHDLEFVRKQIAAAYTTA